MDHYQQLIDSDKQTLWHPYSSFASDSPVFPVVSANGVRLKLADGRELIDGMASWWCAIHGYNHPQMNQAINQQLNNMSHIMFGGLTHPPAIQLAQTLIAITPDTLSSVFFSDSGSVAVEVAMKMAIQYWHGKQQAQKQTFISLRQGYHGDTFGAMSVCDPDTGMHRLFSQALSQQIFIEAPNRSFNEICTEADLASLKNALINNHSRVAAFILEPVVQGAGGMRFYSPDYLNKARALCDEFNVLLIFDEIATGFARTGKLFACEHSQVQPDIMCIGKALTGGYLTLAATLTNTEIAQSISNHEPGVFMHGPTFMANPLACAAANQSIELLLRSDWQSKIPTIESWLNYFLTPCANLEQVAEVRILGAIGVVECKQAVDINSIQPALVDKGVWIRPFGKLIYLMPPYIIEKDEIEKLCSAIYDVLQQT